MLQEVVGEPRFGLDVSAPETPAPGPVWSDLSWVNVDLGTDQRVDVTKKLKGTSFEREGVTWGANASDMAYILYQQPVMVGIHGREMLKKLVLPA